MKIKELCASERPREKLLAEGPARLSDGELIAVLLHSGSRRYSAVELAQQLLNVADGRLSRLFNMEAARMLGISGIGEGKAATVLAAFELGRRFLNEESSLDKTPVVTARSVFEMMLPRLKGISHEECWILLLNDSCYLIKSVKLSSGGGRATVIDARQLQLVDHVVVCDDCFFSFAEERVAGIL